MSTTSNSGPECPISLRPKPTIATNSISYFRASCNRMLSVLAANLCARLASPWHDWRHAAPAMRPWIRLLLLQQRRHQLLHELPNWDGHLLKHLFNHRKP